MKNVFVLTPEAGVGRSTSWIFGIVTALVAFLTFWGPPHLRDWREVATGTDTVPYADIAIQVSRGNGLAENRSDPLIRQWFSDLPAVPDGPPVPSTRWPPLFPVFIGAIFWILGHDLHIALTANCAVMAVAAGLIAGSLARRHGIAIGLTFAVLFVVIDERVRANARTLMTEPLATLLISATALMFMHVSRSAGFRNTVLAGTSCALAILTRSAVFLWVPGLVALIWILSRTALGDGSRASRLAVTFVVTVVVTCSPWFLHNIRALDAFMPLGSHVHSLPSGFSDQAWNYGGRWAPLGADFYADVTSPGDPPLVKARKEAKYGLDRAVDWIVANPLKAIVLAVRKAIDLWAPNPSIALAYLILPILGLAVLGLGGESIVIAAFLLLNTVAVAATWTWELDRFQVPLLGLLHYAGAIGVWTTLRLTRAVWQQ